MVMVLPVVVAVNITPYVPGTNNAVVDAVHEPARVISPYAVVVAPPYISKSPSGEELAFPLRFMKPCGS